MIHFIPTFGSRKVATQTNAFIHQNSDEFWCIFKPLIPYLIGLTLFDVVITNTITPITIGALLNKYIYTCLAISWLRLTIKGKENFIAVNCLKPSKSELIFMATALGIFFIPIAISTIIPIISANTESFITSALIGLIASLLLTVLASYKFAFFFPSQAVGQGITLIQSFKMTKGYVEKTISTSIRSAFKLILKMAIFTLTIKGLELLLGHSKSENTLLNIAYDLIMSLTLSLYFLPFIIITGLSVLSHYYQEALEKKASTHD